MAFEELKQRQSAVWGTGPYERLPAYYEPALDHQARACATAPGDRALDIGCGTGALALRLAATGAEVVGVDLAPALIATATRLAEETGTDARFLVGDAEHLELPDASFDVVASSFGSMFAPDHRAVARELARVCRPGGRLVLGHWSPDVGVVDMFAVIRQFQPPPPEGVGNPFDWGRREYVEELLGDSFELRFEEGNAPLETSSAEEAWELFATVFGPVRTLAETLEETRRENFHRSFVEFLQRYETPEGMHHPRPYVVVVGTRRS